MPIFDKHASRVKMVVLRSGNNEPITWYSIISKDKQRLDKICNEMLFRFSNYLKENPLIRPTINKIHFYEKGQFVAEAEIK